MIPLNGRRVYIAAPWARRYMAIDVGRRVEAVGFTVTSRWFHHDGPLTDSIGASMPKAEVQAQAREDIEDVRGSDLLLVLNIEPSEGKAVETGMALILDIPIISVGPRSNIFQSLAIEVPTVAEALRILEQTWYTDEEGLTTF